MTEGARESAATVLTKQALAVRLERFQLTAPTVEPYVENEKNANASACFPNIIQHVKG